MKSVRYSTRLARNSGGFTLTEMLIVIALIAMVGTFVTTQVMSRFNRAKVDATKIQMRQLGAVLDQYKLDCGAYPGEDQGLSALVEKPTVGRECKNYDPAGYLKQKAAPKDGWGNDFLYFSNGNTYEIKSLGNDGKEGGEGNDADLSSKEID